MIGYLKGNVLAVFKTGKAVSTLVVWPYREHDVGIGISVVVSDVLATALSSDNSIVSLWTYHVYSENSSYLIGLNTKESMDAFLSLLDVSGVGPKTALQIVDTLGVAAFLDAVKMQEISVFSHIPGVGKKTAAKILLELSQSPSLSTLLQGATVISSDKYATVVATLQKLGYPLAKIRDVITQFTPELDQKSELTVSEQVTLLLSKGVL